MKWLLVLGFALFAVGCAAATDSAPTLIPTSIPTNTPAPPPTPDTLLALGAYSTWLGEFLDRVVVANSTEMGQLFSSPLPNNDTWRFEVSQRAHVSIDGADELRVRIPPEAFAATHASMLEAMEAYAEAGSQTLKWL